MNIYIAIPALDELNYLPALIEDLKDQSLSEFKVFVCVNNPDGWWKNKVKKEICQNNINTLAFLDEVWDLDITPIDRAFYGKGWSDKEKGVGHARKVLFEAISKEADDEDLVISLDADTRIPDKYLFTVLNSFRKNKKALLLTNPYYHDLSEDENIDRAILRYEVYMRYYLLNLFMIGSPFAFTAIGSAIAFKMKGYRKINGITPKEAGEDFYFVNRMKKAGKVLVWNKEVVKPSSRVSDRVPFGTGPAVSKGMAGDWDSYPFYSSEAFDRIGETYALLPGLFGKDIETPIDEFIESSFGTNIWEPLRNNFKTEQSFIRACHEKLDGLRILQILKFYDNGKSFENFVKFSTADLGIKLQENFSFESSSVESLNSIRDKYFEFEMQIREKIGIL